MTRTVTEEAQQDGVPCLGILADASSGPSPRHRAVAKRSYSYNCKVTLERPGSEGIILAQRCGWLMLSSGGPSYMVSSCSAVELVFLTVFLSPH